EALLRIRELVVLRLRRHRNRLGTASRTLREPDHPLDRRREQKIAERDRDFEVALDAREEAHGAEAVAAELKEVVGDLDLRVIEDLSPNLHEPRRKFITA